MQKLNTYKKLHKMHKMNIDKIKLKINEFENAKYLSISSRDKAIIELKQEREKQYDISMQDILNQYIEHKENKIKQIESDIINCDKEIENNRMLLRQELSSLQRFEIIIDKIIKTNIEKERKIETKTLDEVAILRHKNESYN